MKITKSRLRKIIRESRAESLLGLPQNPSPQAVYHSIKNYISNIPDPSKDPNADLIDRVIANVMVKHQIRKDDEHIGSKLNMLRRILDPDKARVDSYRRGVESEMRELDPTGKKQKYEYQTPNSLRMRESKTKLSKRQLKQIIKEEYSKLKSLGLIKEYGQVDESDVMRTSVQTQSQPVPGSIASVDWIKLHNDSYYDTNPPEWQGNPNEELVAFLDLIISAELKNVLNGLGMPELYRPAMDEIDYEGIFNGGKTIMEILKRVFPNTNQAMLFNALQKWAKNNTNTGIRQEYME